MPKGKKSTLSRYEAKYKKDITKIQKTTQQAYIHFASSYDILPDSKELYKATVANFILGGSGFGSRLMESIRVKNALAYSIYTRLSINKSSSTFSGYMQTKNENEQKATKLIKSQIKDFINNGVTQKELDSAKKFILGSEPLKYETPSQRIMQKFVIYYKGYEPQKQKLEKIKNLSLKELNSFINKHDEILDLTFVVINNK